MSDTKRKPPFICTQNTLSHVDYGIPIVANKSTDYRTTTGTNHRFIPSIPQHFDCRVKAKIKKECLDRDIAIREDRVSSYSTDFIRLSNQDNILQKCEKPPRKIQDYIINVQEKMFQDPPPPIKPKGSEIKDSYRMQNYRPNRREVLAPAILGTCEIVGLERPLQPPVPTGEWGIWKHLDNYMTTNKRDYPPYSNLQAEDTWQDFCTFSSGTGQYNRKTLKNELPGPLSGNKSVFDKKIFNRQFPVKFFTNGMKRVPYSGLQTENQSQYKFQTYSDMYPYTNNSGVLFKDSLSRAGAWQNLCPPGMYCTEKCHIGTGWRISSIV